MTSTFDLLVGFLESSVTALTSQLLSLGEASITGNDAPRSRSGGTAYFVKVTHQLLPRMDSMHMSIDTVVFDATPGQHFHKMQTISKLNCARII